MTRQILKGELKKWDRAGVPVAWFRRLAALFQPTLERNSEGDTDLVLQASFVTWTRSFTLHSWRGSLKEMAQESPFPPVTLWKSRSPRELSSLEVYWRRGELVRFCVWSKSPYWIRRWRLEREDGSHFESLITLGLDVFSWCGVSFPTPRMAQAKARWFQLNHCRIRSGPRGGRESFSRGCLRLFLKRIGGHLKCALKQIGAWRLGRRMPFWLRALQSRGADEWICQLSSDPGYCNGIFHLGESSTFLSWKVF